MRAWCALVMQAPLPSDALLEAKGAADGRPPLPGRKSGRQGLLGALGGRLRGGEARKGGAGAVEVDAAGKEGGGDAPSLPSAAELAVRLLPFAVALDRGE
jgi:hypothetical protein